MRLSALLIVAGLALPFSQAFAQQPSSSSGAKAERFFALPIELAADSGATNGDATMLRFMPVYGLPGELLFGIGDLMHASFFMRHSDRELKWGVGDEPWALSLQGYYNVIKPDGAPDWSVRLSLIAAIPLGKK